MACLVYIKEVSDVILWSMVEGVGLRIEGVNLQTYNI